MGRDVRAHIRHSGCDCVSYVSYMFHIRQVMSRDVRAYIYSGNTPHRVCVCVCVRERERERERECVCVCVCGRERKCVCVHACECE